MCFVNQLKSSVKQAQQRREKDIITWYACQGIGGQSAQSAEAQESLTFPWNFPRESQLGC